MEHLPAVPIRIGRWRANPATNEISRGGESVRLEARTMRLLLCLAERAGEVVSIEELLNQVWPGVTVSSDSVYQAVASLRRLLGDDAKQPAYIVTVPRMGYRMVAPVNPDVGPAGTSANSPRATPGGGQETSGSANRTSRIAAGLALIAGSALCIALALAFLFHNRNRASAASASPQERSVAVMPFLDLTEQMDKGPFADGMTEELIDKLSKIPGLRVPSATASFYFRGKQVPLPDIAQALGVRYVLDGSVRRSSGWLRVDVRLSRADNGYVLWTETYDRPMANILAIQDDIAGQVAKALQSSIEAEPIRN